MLTFIKKYKYIIITAAAIVAALAIAFAAGNTNHVDIQTPDEATTVAQITETTVKPATSQNTTAADTTKESAATAAAEMTSTSVSTTANETIAENTDEPTEPVTDRYRTEPVPTGKPQPVEPQDQTTHDNTLRCTLSISCATILDNMDKLDEEYHELVPSDGWILKPEQFEFAECSSGFARTRKYTSTTALRLRTIPRISRLSAISTSLTAATSPAGSMESTAGRQTTAAHATR